MDHIEFFKIGIEVDFNKLDEFSEATLRNSLGRLYYYTYHEALKFVREDESLIKIYTDLTSSIPSYHKRLITVFAKFSANTQNLKYGKISRLLSVLHNLRCDADYELSKVFGKNDFLSMLAQLDDLKNVVHELNPHYFNISVSPVNSNISTTSVESGTIRVMRKEISSSAPRKKPILRLLD
ncbi:hypothetical protein ABFO59_05725 [Acinetobacter radioresistens]|uniref:hypothetical protein n=1 Tax=Acinetobacter radioresistens TaxID=40216 RepID=UPI00321379F4